MAFLTTDLIARESLALLRSNVVMHRLCSNNKEAEFTGEERTGETIRIRRRRTGSVEDYNGSSVTKKTIDESSINLTLEKYKDTTVRVTSKQMKLNIKNFSEQVLMPEIIAHAEAFDSYLLGKILDIPNVAGESESAPAGLPDSIGDMALISKTLNDQKVPMAPRYIIASTELNATLLGVDSLVELDKVGDPGALRDAQLGKTMGMRAFMAQNVPTATHTSGTMTSCAVSADVAEGATAIPFDTANGASVTLLDGDIISIAGYGNAVVNGNVTASSSAGTINIVEPVRVGGIPDTTVITVYDGGGNTRQCHGAAFHRDVIDWAAVPLALPQGAYEASIIEDPETGLRMRIVYTYDADLKSDVISIDMLYGAVVTDGRLGAQIVKNI